jgi:hypothetical protein
MGGGGAKEGARARGRQLVAEAARSGLSPRAFCRQRGVPEAQFYTWRARLNGKAQGTARRRAVRAAPGPAFALVSEGAAPLGNPGVELVLGDGRRLRIAAGVDEATLRTVLAVLDPGRC